MTLLPQDLLKLFLAILVGGLIGVGVILRDEGRIVGLTTAAIIWLTAALGMGIGAGQYLLVGVAAGVVAVILWTFPRFEKRIDQFQEGRSYEVTCSVKGDKLRQVEALLRELGLQVRSHKRMKCGDKLIGLWEVWGACSSHEQFVDRLLADAEIEEFVSK